MQSFAEGLKAGARSAIGQDQASLLAMNVDVLMRHLDLSGVGRIYLPIPALY